VPWGAERPAGAGQGPGAAPGRAGARAGPHDRADGSPSPGPGRRGGLPPTCPCCQQTGTVAPVRAVVADWAGVAPARRPYFVPWLAPPPRPACAPWVSGWLLAAAVCIALALVLGGLTTEDGRPAPASRATRRVADVGWGAGPAGVGRAPAPSPVQGLLDQHAIVITGLYLTGGLIVVAVGAVVAVRGLLEWRQRRRAGPGRSAGAAPRHAAERRWAAAVARWHQLYYCRYCNGVFLPDEPDMVAPSQVPEWLGYP